MVAEDSEGSEAPEAAGKRKRGRPKALAEKDAPVEKEKTDQDPKWSEGDAGDAQVPSWPHPASKPKGRPTKHDTRRSVFERFITPAIQARVVEETNKYALLPHVPKTIKARWTPITPAILMGFIGIVMYMGIVKLPARRMYWDLHRNIGVRAIQNCMTRDRFEDIARVLHFETFNPQAPKKGEPGFDKIRPVRIIFDMFKSACLSNWHMGQYVSVDEAMQKMKGKSPVRTYMPNKPVKYGYKFWCLCCAGTGYLYNFDIYQGKLQKEPEKNLGANVVMALSAVLVAGSVVCCDRFFTSLLLVTLLLARGVRCIGTIMTNKKGFPKYLIMSKGEAQRKLARGHTAVASFTCADGDVHVNRWMDNKPVYFISSSQTGEPGSGTVKRLDKGTGKRIEVQCSDTVAEYQKYMGGVDHFDHFRSAYTCRLKMHGKWYHYIWWWIVESSCVNACIVYNYNPNFKTEKPLDFRFALAKILMAAYTQPKRDKRFASSGHKAIDPLGRLVHRPMLYHLDDPTVQDRAKQIKTARNDCHICKAMGFRAKAMLFCIHCNIVMHEGYCCERFHTVEEWSKGLDYGKVCFRGMGAGVKSVKKK